nr:MAG TPA: hypothetical protein [Caudoviricetes sp.]
MEMWNVLHRYYIGMMKSALRKQGAFIDCIQLLIT